MTAGAAPGESTSGRFPDEGQTSFETDVEGSGGSAGPSTGPESEAGAPFGGEPGGAEAGEAGAAAPERHPAEVRVAELTADLQRLQAEYLNYKRRVDRDRELVLQNAKLSILSALFPVLDDVDRAREHGELDGGFKAVAEALERVVNGEGLVKFGAAGDEFDPRLHEALMHAHSPDVTTTTCERVVQAGYQFGDRVVRPALVTVVDPEPGQVSSDGAAADAPAADAGEGAGSSEAPEAGEDQRDG